MVEVLLFVGVMVRISTIKGRVKLEKDGEEVMLGQLMLAENYFKGSELLGEVLLNLILFCFISVGHIVVISLVGGNEQATVPIKLEVLATMRGSKEVNRYSAMTGKKDTEEEHLLLLSGLVIITLEPEHVIEGEEGRIGHLFVVKEKVKPKDGSGIQGGTVAELSKHGRRDFLFKQEH